MHGHQVGGHGVVESRLFGVDDDDVLAGRLVPAHRGARVLALGAVADEDRVVSHSVPPTLNLPGLPRPLGEHLKGRADQHHEEQDPQRREDHDVGQPGEFGVRGEVAVADCGQGDRGEIQAVDERQRHASHIGVAGPTEVDGHHRDHQGEQGDRDPSPNSPHRTDMRLRHAHDADQRVSGLGGQRLVEIASMTANFDHSSSARPSTRHNVTMTAITHSPQRDASQTLAYRIAALLLGVGTLHFVAPKPFDGIIPVELPGSPRFYTYASGVAEVGIGGALLVRSTRRLAALAAAALFVAVFPGNLNMVRLWWDKPWPMRIIALARLPLQIPMVTAALKVARTAYLDVS